MYVPESDPEDEELNGIFQWNRDFENNIFKLGFGSYRKNSISF